MATNLRTAIKDHLGTAQVARVIYGAIIGLALVVALEDHPPAAGAVVATLIATAVAVALAELYSDVVGTEVRTRHRISREHVGHLLRDVTAVAFGIAFPAVFFVLAAAGALELERAFAFAKWTGLSLICFYGFCAARLAGTNLGGSLLQSAVVGLIGGFLIALKAVVH
jgi:hypothetical protein